MSALSTEKWTQLNQRYLMKAIQVMRETLAQYRDKLKGKAAPEGTGNGLEQAKRELQALEAELGAIRPAFLQLAGLLRLSDFERAFLLLCAGMELDSQLARMVRSLLDNPGLSGPTFGLGLSALPDAHWSAITPDAPLRRWRLIELEKGHQALTNAPCLIDESILHYFLGVSSLDHRLQSWVHPISVPEQLVPSHQQLADQLAGQLERMSGPGKYPILHIRGGSSQDQMAVVAQAFSRFQLGVYLLPFSAIPAHTRELNELIQLWNREYLLHHRVLYLDASRWDGQDPRVKGQVGHLLEHLNGIVALGGELQVAVQSRGVVHYEMSRPTIPEQIRLWQDQLGDLAGLPDGHLEKITSQFDLDAHAIQNLADLARSGLEAGSNGTPSTESLSGVLWKACCDHTRPDLDELGQRIEPMAKWDDLVLPELQKATLQEIAVQVAQRQKVYERWGFAQKSHRGLGINALFSGESGTGKTMAAEVLAQALQLDLYRIDLSQVVNKYIGETEKNLKRIFDAAEGSGAILLFDEADALFGKRSEVKDSHDRYSNIEVSYLLQKMEAYKGLAILTTNMKNALDKAFLRRIRFVVQFPFPDAQMRAEIWKRIFPAQTPTEDLNIAKLSALNIAGGNIRNIALNAAFSAAGRNRPVTMLDIQAAARQEYTKLEKQMSSSESVL